MLTSGISAEYGRFSGGVVNVITKSGGNLFSGAFRSNFTQPGVERRDAAREERGHDAGEQALADLRSRPSAGRCVRDRVWFFGGSRIERTTTQGTFAQTRIPYTSHERQHALRRQADRHASPAATRCRARVIDNRTDLVQPAFGGSIDPAAMTTPSTLNRLVRGELARRARRAHVRDRAVLAEELEAAERRRHRAPTSSSRRS